MTGERLWEFLTLQKTVNSRIKLKGVKIMSAELEIFEINFDRNFRQHGHTVTFKQIGDRIYDSNLIEILMEVSRNNYWHLEGECGFIGELLGKDISAVLENTDTKQPKNKKLILDNLKGDDFYRIQVSF